MPLNYLALSSRLILSANHAPELSSQTMRNKGSYIYRPYVTFSEESQPHIGLYQQEQPADPRRSRESLTLCTALVKPHLKFWIHVWTLQYKTDIDTLECAQQRPLRQPEHWSIWCTSRIWVCSVLENKSKGRSYCCFQLSMEKVQRRMENSGNMIQLPLLHLHSMRNSTVLIQNYYTVVHYFHW